MDFRFYSIIIILFVLLCFFQYRLWFQSGGISDLIHLKQKTLRQAEENVKLKKRNVELLFQIERIRNSKDATESRARNELGMVKKDETFYQIVRSHDRTSNEDINQQ